MYASLEHSFSIRDDKNIFKLPRKLAPIQVAVFPLVNKDNLEEKAEEIYNTLRMENIYAFYDRSGSIGKRYARMDEIGTPFCITVDFEINDNNTVTIRDRDTGEQIRLKPEELATYIKTNI
jgi:glycyl-tRNA synthetase